MYLFFDTETTGLPPGGDNVHLCQLAFLLQSDSEHDLAIGNFIIRPDGWSIPPEVADIHGITTERALRQGLPVGEVLSVFTACCYMPVSLIAHNIPFDQKVVAKEFERLGWENAMWGKRPLCTMQASTELCALPRKRGGGFKWPKLSELHTKLFGAGFEGAHNAANDVGALVKCFWELRRLGRI
jgi:DNA polymerase-3 subunit epsilon